MTQPIADNDCEMIFPDKLGSESFCRASVMFCIISVDEIQKFVSESVNVNNETYI